jgi:hypothetical protein
MSAHRTLTAAAFALLVPLVFAACERGGSGSLGRETRNVSGVRSVELTGAGELIIEQTGEEVLTVETDDNLLPNVSSDIVDGVLKLEVKGAIAPTKGIKYTLNVADLDGITITGSGTVAATALAIDSLDVSISGSGTVTVAGTSTSQTIDIAGAGQYRASELANATAKVSISGSGSADVQVHDRLEVNIAGSGSVTYLGTPIIDQEVSGSGTLTRR